MKLQIDGDRLRFRVDEAEFARLLEGQLVEAVIVLPGQPLRLQLQPVGDGPIRLEDAAAGRLCLQLPAGLLDDYRGRLPCRDGLDAEQALDGEHRLRLSFEVDVRDSIRQRGPPRRR
jgi:hypothetical protein